MEDFHTFYVALATGGAVVGGVLGLIYSVYNVFFLLKFQDKATWEPLPFVIGFAILWPVVAALFPVLILHEAVEFAHRTGKPWGVRTWEARWFRLAQRFIIGVIAGIMLCYVAGFFI